MSNFKLSCDEQGFISNISFLFPNTNSFITELCQNSRRACATYIEIEANKESQVITFRDNGAGISDFNVLFRANKSGHIGRDNENPFGLGFLSVFAVADRVIVKSKAGVVDFKTSDLLNNVGASATEDAAIEGTEITLFLKGSAELEFAYKGDTYDELLRGFNTPITFNKVPLKQFDAFVKEDYIEGRWGYYKKANLNAINTNPRQSRLYCQGLMVNCDKFAVPVHLKDKTFFPVLPARDRLINHDVSILKIKNDIKKCGVRFVRSELEKVIASGDLNAEKALLEQYDNFIVAYSEDFSDLLKSSNFLLGHGIHQLAPGSVIEFQHGVEYDVTGFEYNPKTPILKSALAEGMVIPVGSLDIIADRTLYSVLSEISDKRTIYILEKDEYEGLPLDDINLIIPDYDVKIGKELSSQWFGGDYVGFTVKVFESLKLRFQDEIHDLACLATDNELLIARDCILGCYTDVLQYSDYFSDFVFEELSYDKDCQQLGELLAELDVRINSDDDPVKLIQIFLDKAGLLPEKLRSKSFQINVDNTGQVIVA